MSQLRQLTRKLLWLVLIWIYVWLGTILPADAATVLRRSDPADGARLDYPPAEVFAWFAAPLTGRSQLEVFDEDFNAVSLNRAYIDENDVTLLRVPLETLSAGRYSVRWQADSRDGKSEVGTFYFSVMPDPLPISPPVLIAASVSAFSLVASLSVWGLLRLIRRR